MPCKNCGSRNSSHQNTHAQRRAWLPHNAATTFAVSLSQSAPAKGKVPDSALLSSGASSCCSRRRARRWRRSEEHTSELQSLMRISYAVFCLKKKKELITNEKLKQQEP